MVYLLLLRSNVYTPQIDTMAEHVTDVNSALKITGWRSAQDLTSMSTEDERNTLIVELNHHSNLSIHQLQAKHNTGSLNSLTGMAAICYFLYTNNICSIHSLNSMSDQDQRNTLIVELNKKVNKEISELQGMNDHELVVCGADFYRKDKAVAKVTAIRWNISEAKIVDQTPEMLAQQTYDNRHSNQVLMETFSYKKTITKTTTFQHSTSLNISTTTEFSVKAGIPVIAEVSGKVSVTMGALTTWTNANSHTISQAFEKSTKIEVKPGGYIRRKSTLTVGSMDVPYTMDVETQTGRQETVGGMWHGVTLYNIQEIQEDIHE